MTDIESIWRDLSRAVAGYQAPDGVTYQKSVDPFTVDLDPRGDVAAYYIDPPKITISSEYLGGGGSELAEFVIWLSRPRGEDGEQATQRVMRDLGRIRQQLEDEKGDWHIPSRTARVTGRAPRSPAVHVLASMRIEVDYEADEAA